MKIIVSLFLISGFWVQAIDITDTDMFQGYKRIFDFNSMDDAQEEKILDAFDKRADALKNKLELWCLTCQQAKDFEKCLAQHKYTIFADEIDEKCVLNIFMAKFEGLVKLISKKYTISDEGFKKLMKIAIFDLTTNE